MRTLLLATLATVGAACAPATAPTAATPTPGSAEAAPAAPTAHPPDPSHVLSLRGSNTLGLAYAPRVVRAFLAHEGATDIQTRDELHTAERTWMTATLHGEAWWIEIYTPGTKYGFDSLAAGYCDVVLASRPVNDGELAKTAKLGDLTAPASEHVVAMDGIAVIVHPNLPIEHVTMAQLESIFAGTVTRWSELGGPDVAIHVLSRDAESGTHAFADNAELAQTVRSTEGAIGFVGLPYIGQTKALAIQNGQAQALLPTPFTVATEDYALARRLFLYTATSPKPLAQELVEFAMSDAGQAVVADAGFVPLSLRAEVTKVTASAPAAYKTFAASATRLSVDFRFKLGSSQVDTKALHDLDRLASYLALPTNRGRKLALAGFADAQGNDSQNDALSKQRAEAIAKLLAERGVDANVASFGSALPIAPNDTPQGRARNRRVEAWLR